MSNIDDRMPPLYVRDMSDFLLPSKSHIVPWEYELADELEKQLGTVETIIYDYLLPRKGERIRDIELHLAGKGRTANQVRDAGSRFSQIGYLVRWYEDDLKHRSGFHKDVRYISLIASGSGLTDVPVDAAEEAKKYNVPVILFTSYPEECLGTLADEIVVIKGRTKKDVETGERVKEHINYLGTQFERKLGTALTLLVTKVAKELGITEEEMKNGHNQDYKKRLTRTD